MNHEYSISHFNQEAAEQWVSNQGTRIFGVQYEPIIIIDLSGNEVEAGVRVKYNEHTRERNINYFPQDNWGGRSFGKIG